MGERQHPIQLSFPPGIPGIRGFEETRELGELYGVNYCVNHSSPDRGGGWSFYET
jgi:hypothetical protein